MRKEGREEKTEVVDFVKFVFFPRVFVSIGQPFCLMTPNSSHFIG